MQVTKIKAGKYQVIAHGFVFTLTNELKDWVLWNKTDTQVMRLTSKSAILQTLGYLSGHELQSLNTQEWCSV